MKVCVFNLESCHQCLREGRGDDPLVTVLKQHGNAVTPRDDGRQGGAGGTFVPHTGPAGGGRGAALGGQQLQKLLADVGVEPAVDHRVGDGGGHGGHVTHGQSRVEVLGGDVRKGLPRVQDVDGEREDAQR